MSRWLIVLLAVLLPLQLAWSGVAHLCVDAHEVVAVHASAHGSADGGADQSGGDPSATVGGHCHGHFTALPLSLDVVTVAMARFEGAAPVASLLATRPSPRPERPQWPTLA